VTGGVGDSRTTRKIHMLMLMNQTSSEPAIQKNSNPGEKEVPLDLLEEEDL
jgi:hypothetical protein